MSDQTLALDLSDLTVESIKVTPADSLDSAAYGHGTLELGASCGLLDASCVCREDFEED